MPVVRSEAARSRCVAVAALLLGALALEVCAGERCRAVDGGTLRCGREVVRIREVRAPELTQPGGRDARQRLQKRIGSGEVTIRRRGKDGQGRTLGDVYVDGKRIHQSDIGPGAGGRGRH